MVERLEGGEVSGYLHDAVEVGDPLEVRGPFGGWFVWNGARAGAARRRRLGRRPADVDAAPPPPGRAVRAAAAGGVGPLPRGPAVRRASTAARPRSSTPGARRRAGRGHRAALVAADLQPLLIPDATAYVCGSAAFAEHASQLLVDLGVPAPSVRVERYGPTA